MSRSGDIADAEANAERVFALASEKGIAQFFAWALMMLGWAMVKRGAADAGVAKMEEGFAAWGAPGNQYHIPHRLEGRHRRDAARSVLTPALGGFGEARGRGTFPRSVRWSRCSTTFVDEHDDIPRQLHHVLTHG